MRKLVLLSIVAFVAVMVAAPSVMAKKALNEDELDMITAAGQPKIIQAVTGSITFTDSPVNTLSLSSNSQRQLAALTLNNVVGEVQLANALNIASDAITVGPTQANTILQSWGATKDWTSSTVAGVTATSSASAAATASVNVTCTKCGINRGGDANASTSAAAAAATSPGQIKILTKYADQIVETEAGDVVVEQNGVATLSLETGSQEQLAALVVNNIVGLSQVANATNISSGTILLNVGGIAVNSSFGPVGFATNQTNTITQFRGTPYSRPAAP